MLSPLIVSPNPLFDTDESTYVLVTIPVHVGVLLNNQVDGETKGINERLSERLNKVVNDAINDGLIDGVSDIIKKELIKVVSILLKDEGIKSDEIVVRIGKGTSTVERYISILRKIDIVELRGSKKIGGYYLTEIAQEIKPLVSGLGITVKYLDLE